MIITVKHHKVNASKGCESKLLDRQEIWQSRQLASLKSHF
jgi:hypothetical protein